MKTSEIRRNYQEWTSSLRREDWDGWGIYCAWKTTVYQSKPYDGKWTHAPEGDPEDRDWTGLTLDTVTLDPKSIAWPGKRQKKQQLIEKTGMDVWPNVSSTRAELRSQVCCLLYSQVTKYIAATRQENSLQDPSLRPRLKNVPTPKPCLDSRADHERHGFLSLTLQSINQSINQSGLSM